MASKYLMLHFLEELIGTHDIQLCHKLWEDDSDIIIVLYVFQKVFQRRQFVPKVLGFVETIVSGYSNRDFVMDFRIEKQTFLMYRYINFTKNAISLSVFELETSCKAQNNCQKYANRMVPFPRYSDTFAIMTFDFR